MINKKWRFIPAVILALVLLAAGAVYVYASDYYHADETAVQACASQETVTVTCWSHGQYVFSPENPVAGLIFYPGGKVEYSAYAPLLQELAQKDILCVVKEMPLNLAVLDVDAAEDIMMQNPEITEWYIGGHSLGGSMAASYAADNAEDFEGLLLLAAYSTKDLSETDMDVFSVYGSEDQVLNMEKYEKYRSNLPEDTYELVIEGGDHAGFGSYGTQAGDGKAYITGEQQVAEAVDFFTEKINED